jgi:hypothetical protein
VDRIDANRTPAVRGDVLSNKLAKSNPPRSSRRVCVLVLGMHRSGTSAFVRVLNLLGCDLPRTLVKANRSNEAGHWESTPVCRLNDRILASAGTDWDDWLELNPGWIRSPKAEEFREEALAVLQEEFGSSRLFVLKDPRICRLVPFWLDVLEEADARPLIVSPVRNPLEVAASLENRNGFEAGLGQLFWLRHVLDAEFASRGIPRFFTSYERLLSGWARTAEDAQSTLKIAWPRMSFLVAAEIEAFLSYRLRHHKEQRETVLENPRLSNWLRGAYQVLGNWATAGEKSEDFAALDHIRTELNAAAPAFSRLIASGQRAAGQITKADRVLAEMQKKLARAEEAKAAVQQKATRLEVELVKARRRLGETERQIAQLKNDLKSASARGGNAERSSSTGAAPAHANGRGE